MKKIAIVGILLVITFLTVISNASLAQDLQNSESINSASGETTAQEEAQNFLSNLQQLTNPKPRDTKTASVIIIVAITIAIIIVLVSWWYKTNY